MAVTGFKSFNWVRTPSAWESIQTWREKRRAAAEDFTSISSAAANAFANAHVSLGSGMAEIAAKIGNARVQAAVAAKQKAALKAAGFDVSI